MLLASPMTDHICLFLNDLLPLSCTASGIVTEADWRMKAEQLWPGATTNLPGDPKKQVLAFCGLAPTFCVPFQRLDHSRILPPRESYVSILVVLKHGHDSLWSGISRIHLRELCASEEADIGGIVADFKLPNEAARRVEEAVIQWVEGDHPLRYGLPGCDLRCLLQVWMCGAAGQLHVIEPYLVRFGIRYEWNPECGFVGTVEFDQLALPGDTCVYYPLTIKTYRFKSRRTGHTIVIGRVFLRGEVCQGDALRAPFFAGLNNARRLVTGVTDWQG